MVALRRRAGRHGTPHPRHTPKGAGCARRRPASRRERLLEPPSGTPSTSSRTRAIGSSGPFDEQKEKSRTCPVRVLVVLWSPRGDGQAQGRAEHLVVEHCGPGTRRGRACSRDHRRARPGGTPLPARGRWWTWAFTTGCALRIERIRGPGVWTTARAPRHPPTGARADRVMASIGSRWVSAVRRST